MSVSLPNDVHSVPLRLILCLFLIAEAKVATSHDEAVFAFGSRMDVFIENVVSSTQQGVLHNWSCNGRRQSKGCEEKKIQDQKIKFSYVQPCVDAFVVKIVMFV